MISLKRQLCDIAAEILKIAAESEDIVRCMDCRYINKAAFEGDPSWCEAWQKKITENGYCHKGRRKE